MVRTYYGSPFQQVLLTAPRKSLAPRKSFDILALYKSDYYYYYYYYKLLETEHNAGELLPSCAINAFSLIEQTVCICNDTQLAALMLMRDRSCTMATGIYIQNKISLFKKRCQSRCGAHAKLQSLKGFLLLLAILLPFARQHAELRNKALVIRGKSQK